METNIVKIALLLLFLAVVAFYFNIISFNHEIKTELLVDKFLSLHIKFSNGSEVDYPTEYPSSSPESLVLQKGFNITFFYAYSFLRPKDDSLPVTFIYIPRVFLVLHIVFPNNSEVVLGNFIIHPWGGGSVQSMCLGGYKEGRVYAPYYGEYEIPETSEPTNPLKLHIPFASNENLTELIHNLISKYSYFSILIYAPSSFTVLNKTQFQIVYDSCISRLDFKNVDNNSVMLNITITKPESLGVYKLVYDQKTLERRSTVYSLQFSLCEIVFLIVVGLVAFHSYSKFNLTKNLLVLGIVLFILGFFSFFNFMITHVDGVKINIFFYSYLTDGNLSYPLEVVWHLSRTISNGTKVVWNFNPNRIGYAFLVGYNCFNLPGLLCHRTNPRPTDSIFNGLANTYVYVNLYNNGNPYLFNSSYTNWILQPGSSTFYTQNLTMPLPLLSENEGLTFNASASILAVWSGQNIKGSYIEENLKLCEIKIKKEKNHTLIESFYLPAVYIQPSADVVEEAKEFEQIINLLLELTGLIFVLASTIELNRQEYFVSKALSEVKKKLVMFMSTGFIFLKRKLQHK